MIISLDELPSIRQRHAEKRIVLTSGTFDLFHVGHLEYLSRVKAYGDIVIVLLSGDSRVKARKGDKRPIIKEADRARILNSLKVVDYVLIDPSRISPDKTDPVHQEIFDRLDPDFYVTDGPDPRFINLLDSKRFVILDRTNSETSTSSIIERIVSLYH